MSLLGKLSRHLIRFSLSLLTELFWREALLLSKLVREVEQEGLSGEVARREVQRRFRRLYPGEISTVLLNLLIETVLMSQPERLSKVTDPAGPPSGAPEQG